jgi:hypothetical protein
LPLSCLSLPSFFLSSEPQPSKYFPFALFLHSRFLGFVQLLPFRIPSSWSCGLRWLRFNLKDSVRDTKGDQISA